MAIKEGLLIKVIAGFYYVETGNSLFTCKAKGSLKNDNLTPVAGDRVMINTEKSTLDKVLFRKNLLKRPPVSNIDKLFIITSFSDPAPNLINIDRMTAIAEHNKIMPIIVFNKSDLSSDENISKIYSDAGYTTIVTSAFNDDCKEKILPHLKNAISVFTGNSGVGKSSILNKIFDSTDFKTNEISKKLGRGRHTTRHTELFKISGGYVADTPGFSSLNTELISNIKPKDLAYCFKEFSPYLGNCRFSDCSHTCEVGCDIINAVNNGKISISRFNSYKQFYNELVALKEW